MSTAACLPKILGAVEFQAKDQFIAWLPESVVFFFFFF